jgi:hypothetical protein
MTFLCIAIVGADRIRDALFVQNPIALAKRSYKSFWMENY